MAIYVTADSSLTADSHCWTADGRIVCTEADIHEAAPALDQLDAVRVADTTVDNVDAVVVALRNVVEAAGAFDQLDAVAIPAGVVLADVVEAATALDAFDAAVISVEVPVDVVVGRYEPRRRPFPVVGRGYGILPQIEGEAHGVVGAVAKGAAQIVVRADALGACGQAGDAAATLKGLSVVGHGAIGARGRGEGTIVKFSGSATGHHDDDEAAVIAFLLAA